MTEQRTDFIVVHTLASRFEADLLRDALEKENVPVLLRSFEETPYDGLFVKQRGWGCLMVPDDLAFTATQIIQPLIEEMEAKRLYNDPAQVDPSLWERLRQAAPEEICTNSLAVYDAAQGAYTVPFLETMLKCFPDGGFLDVEGSAAIHKLNFELYLITLHYLLEAQPVAVDGKWVSEKDIPGGELFFRGPHAFPTERLVDLFGARPDLFASAAGRLGGTEVRMGDVAYRLWPFPRVPVLFVLWTGDEEFAPSMQIRFDESISKQLHALDTIWAMINVVCRSLYRVGKEMEGTPNLEGGDAPATLSD